MRIIKKILKYLFIFAFLFVLACPLWLKFVSSQYFSVFVGQSPIIDKLLCDFSTKVLGESMNPIITPGTSINLTRCFAEENLILGSVVLFNDGSTPRFGIIRHVLPLTPIVYKISDEKAPKLLHDIIKSEIIGVANNIDISGSRYQAEQDSETFILNPDDYIAELYLAKIPKETGIEMTTPEKTTVFSLEKDKFCSAVVPRKNLTDVDIVIEERTTQNIIFQSTDIVLNAKPNINCHDFGHGPGTLNLKSGSYNYKFLLNHQTLKSIQFEVE